MERDLRVISNVDFIFVRCLCFGFLVNHGIRGMTRKILTQRRRDF